MAPVEHISTRETSTHSKRKESRTAFTFALRTVQRKELVALSYRRSNSNVPKAAVVDKEMINY